LVDIVPFPLNAPAADEDYRNALAERALPYTAALAGACPRLGLSANLLPPERRAAPSRWIYMPTVALLVILVVVATALAVQTGYDNRRYAAALEQEVRKLEPRANRIAAIDRDITNARARTRALDEFRRRSKADMDALNELTQILPPPIWLTQLELTRSFIHIAGEAEQAAPLLRVVDESKLFVGSEFTMPLARVSGGEAFRIRAQREGAAQ
jgi:Tfp pilus assembly protein PilN